MTPLWSPARVAKERGTPERTVREAISDGTLRAKSILGPAGNVVGWGVRPQDAMEWIPRKRGRPRKEVKTES